MDGSSESVKIFTLSDSSGYFISGRNIALNSALVWRYIISASPLTSCQAISTFGTFAKDYYKISDSQLFLIGSEPSSPYSLLLYKYAFGNTFTDWVSKMSWQSGIWAVHTAETMISSDNLKIYSFYLYGSVNVYIYFVTLSVSDGSVLGSRYKSSIAWSNIYGSKINGDYLLVNTNWVGQFITFVNTATSVIVNRAFAGSYSVKLNWTIKFY